MSMAPASEEAEYSSVAGLPQEDGSVSYWLARGKAQSLIGLNAKKPLPEEVDVLIIGSGIAGTVAAYNLMAPAETGPDDGFLPSVYAGFEKSAPLRVAMLEAREISSGATGRNGGHVRPDVFASFPRFSAFLGDEMAHKVLVNERETLEYLAQLVTAEQIQCDFNHCTTADVFLSEGAMARERNAFDQYTQWGGIDSDVRFCDSPEEAQRVTRVKGALGMATWAAASMYPYRFATSLVSHLIQRGLDVYTQAPVDKIEQLLDGTWKATLAARANQRGGTVRARQVLLATNAYTPHLVPIFKQHVYPRRAWCSAIVPTKSFTGMPRQPRQGGEFAQEGIIPYTFSIKTSTFGYEYFVPRPLGSDGTWILGGASSVLSDDQVVRSSTDDSPGLAGVTCGGTDDPEARDALTRVAHFFSEFPQKHFNGWSPCAGEGLERVWSGILGYTKDSLPYVGELPTTHIGPLQTEQQPQVGGEDGTNLFVCVGFHGHGMARAATCARGAARLMLRAHHDQRMRHPNLSLEEWERATLLPGAFRWDSGRAAQDKVDYRRVNIASDSMGAPSAAKL